MEKKNGVVGVQNKIEPKHLRTHGGGGWRGEGGIVVEGSLNRAGRRPSNGF